LPEEILKLISLSHVDPAHIVEHLVRLLMAIGLSSVAAVCYAYIQKKERVTVHNLPYTMVMFSVMAAGMMMVIGDSVAKAFGLVGALSVLRFRLNIKNPTDMAAILFTLVIGITCGIALPSIASLFTLVVLAVFLCIHMIHEAQFTLKRDTIIHGGAKKIRKFLSEIESRFAAKTTVNNPESMGKHPLWNVTIRFTEKSTVKEWEAWLRAEEAILFSTAKYEIAIDLSKWGKDKSEED
jgi:uncharacterized membrane protein YhiD involved in acid resistance